MPMQPGQLGPYRLIRPIGRGGMGTVYEAINVETNESAAIKALATDLGSDLDFRERFGSEIEALRRLNHPGIVKLFGFGEQDGQLYYAMELIEGESLDAQLRSRGRFDWREVLRFGPSICRALRHAHDRGIIHRDLKPANLLLSATGEVKLSDFGIACLFGENRMTSTGHIIGTVEYMSPEQAESNIIGPRSDLYSLGGVFYALFAGVPPFRAKSLPKLLDQLRHSRPVRLDRLVPDFPEEVAILIDQLLEKNPDLRLPNALVLERRLEVLYRGLCRADGETSTTGTIDESIEGEIKNDNFEIGPATQESDDPEELGQTRAITEGKSHVDWAEDRPRLATFHESTSEINSNVSDLPESTAEFVPPSESGNQTSVEPTSELPQSSKGPSTNAGAGVTLAAAAMGESSEESNTGNHFTPVSEDELDQTPSTEPVNSPLVSAHTWIMVVCLLAIGFFSWYLLRPPTVDQLYRRIAAKTASGTIEAYRNAEPEMQDFCLRFPNDSRVMILNNYQKEIDLARQQRKFELRAKGLGDQRRLLPIEQIYYETINAAWIEPEQGIARLEALLQFYEPSSSTPGPKQRCLDLANRQLEKLRWELAEMSQQHLSLIKSELDRADQLCETNPDKARQKYQAAITLYQSKPWAKKMVDRAQKSLDSLDLSAKKL
jgi:eukaryotic-like serine/threonine-protein kinase